jgi:hypothetical protein
MPLSVEELMYRRSREYATKLYFAHLEATHQNVPKMCSAVQKKIDEVQSRLMEEYPYSRLI